MKNLRLNTLVEAPFETVWKGFDLSLFMALQPGFPKTEVLRFDGCQPGDKVETNIVFFGIKQPFYSEITARKKQPAQAYFIDEGTKLPFFLRYWQHKHSVSKISENTTCITDEIWFGSYNIMAELFLYPVIYGQIWSRKSIYKNYFRTK